MKSAIQHFFIRLLLSVLRSLVWVKQRGGPVLRKIASPFIWLGRFLLRFLVVPLYRLFFSIRFHLARVVMPAKNRLLYLVSNRLIIHFSIAVVTIFTVAFSLGQSEVRAENFGSQSLLYSLVVVDDYSEIEVVSAAPSSAPAHPSYFNRVALDPYAHLDFDYVDTDYVAGAGQTPTTVKTPVPPRSEVEKYVVQEQDTLGGIAENFGLNLSTLLWANDLTVRSIIRPGQELVILPVDGVQYTVKKGDQLATIAKTYGAELNKIVAYNRLVDANDLVVGESLIIPDGEKPAPVVRRTAPVTSLFSAPATSTGGARGSSVGKGSWVWPSDWRVITQYYSWRHKGLDVDGDYNTNNYAAYDGVVTYSGWYKGYGYTVDIDHGNGIMTRYAHHSKLYVKKGDAVKAGQSLGATGTTGRSTGTHLHFEVRKNGVPQNPLDWVR